MFVFVFLFYTFPLLFCMRFQNFLSFRTPPPPPPGGKKKGAKKGPTPNRGGGGGGGGGGGCQRGPGHHGGHGLSRFDNAFPCAALKPTITRMHAAVVTL